MAAVFLLSAGLDSTVATAEYLNQSHSGGLALTFDYGQRAAAREISSAARIAAFFGLEHRVIAIPFLAGITKTALVDRTREVPVVDKEALDKIFEVTAQTAAKVWVPNRNGLFINIAGAFAESLDYDTIVTGFNAEEAATFPDNSPQFVLAANKALSLSTLNQVKLVSPTQNLNKMEIVKYGLALKIPWQHLWSCYHGEDRMCGRCESCQRLKRALESQQEIGILELLFAVKEAVKR